MHSCSGWVPSIHTRLTRQAALAVCPAQLRGLLCKLLWGTNKAKRRIVISRHTSKLSKAEWQIHRAAYHETEPHDKADLMKLPAFRYSGNTAFSFSFLRQNVSAIRDHREASRTVILLQLVEVSLSSYASIVAL